MDLNTRQLRKWKWMQWPQLRSQERRSPPGYDNYCRIRHVWQHECLGEAQGWASSVDLISFWRRVVFPFQGQQQDSLVGVEVEREAHNLADCHDLWIIGDLTFHVSTLPKSSHTSQVTKKKNRWRKIFLGGGRYVIDVLWHSSSSALLSQQTPVIKAYNTRSKVAGSGSYSRLKL